MGRGQGANKTHAVAATRRSVESPFTVLGLLPSCSAAEIKSAYRKQAKTYHPDQSVLGDADKAGFQRINDAYEKLNTDEKLREARIKFPAAHRPPAAPIPVAPKTAKSVFSKEAYIKPKPFVAGLTKQPLVTSQSDFRSNVASNVYDRTGTIRPITNKNDYSLPDYEGSDQVAPSLVDIKV
jgi:hypothetical protein